MKNDPPSPSGRQSPPNVKAAEEAEHHRLPAELPLGRGDHRAAGGRRRQHEGDRLWLL